MVDLPMAEINVRVATRVRPLLAKERLSGEESCVRVIPETNQIIMGKDKGFTFDYVFSPKSNQEEVYECVSPLVENIFEGYNSTVFAYGQTGSGKTFTVGTWNQESLLEEEKGIIPRAIEQIYAFMESNRQQQPQDSVTYTVKTSFIEIYKEEIRDLLDTATLPGATKELPIREDDRGNTIITGMCEVECPTKADLIDCLDTGSANRVTGMTQMNEVSSRSHCVFTVSITQEWKNSLAAVLNRSPNTAGSESNRSDVDSLEHCITGKFHFVDLAGSERAHKTGNVGDRFKESIHINSGLLALGNVISALGDPKKKRVQHIPYRESKITRILKDSLGGNARTLMICCISPAWSNCDESVNALKYANRARNIRNRPVMNRDKTSVKMEELQTEILALREELNRQKSSATILHGVYEEEEDYSTSTLAELNRLKLHNDHLGLLVNRAKDHLTTVLDVGESHDCSEYLQGVAKEWLELANELENQVPTSLSNSRVWESAAMKRLQHELDKAKNDLANDEEIFAEKAKEINEKKSRIEKLNAAVIEAESKINHLESLSRDQETRLIEQQRKLDYFQNAQNQKLPSLSENVESEDPPTRRVQSVPSHRHNRRLTSVENIENGRDIKTSPALFSIDRVMQNFRARSQLLANQIEDQEEVLRPEFPDIKSTNSVVKSAGGSGLGRHRTFRIKGDRDFNASGNAGSDFITGNQSEGDTFAEGEDLGSVTEYYKKQIKVSHLRLTEANQKMRDLSINIRMKEQLIKELVKSSKDTSVINKKNENKIKDLEIEREQTMKEYSELQKKLEEVVHSTRDNETVELRKIKEDYEKKVEDTKKKLILLQKKQKETEKINSLSNNHEKKIQDLSITIERMRQDQQNTHKKLKEELDHKSKLERDMQKDQERIKQLEIKNEHQSKILKRKQEEIVAVQKKLRRGSGSGLSEDQEKLEEQRRWLDEEVEKVLDQKRQMDELEKELRRREAMLAKKEEVLSEKAELEMKKMRVSQTMDKDYLKVSNRLDLTERELLEKQRLLLTTPDRERNKAEQDIRGLRTEREKLVDARRNMEQKLHEGGLLNDAEERRLIELDEAIETIDEAIQYKDESILFKQEALRQSQKDVSTSRDNLFGRLQELDPQDTRQLLMRYFDKVVGLREDLRKKVLSQSELEDKCEENQRMVDQLKRGIEKQASDTDRRVTQHQQLFEREKRLLMEQLATTGPGTDSTAKLTQLERELQSYKKTNRELKKKIKEWVLSGRLVADIDLHELGPAPGSYSSRPNTGGSEAPPGTSHRTYQPQDYTNQQSQRKPVHTPASSRWERVESTPPHSASQHDTHRTGAPVSHRGDSSGQTAAGEVSKSRRSQLSVFDSLENNDS